MSDSGDYTTAETHSAAGESDKMSDEARGLVGRGVRRLLDEWNRLLVHGFPLRAVDALEK
jgi:hypothetical protein